MQQHSSKYFARRPHPFPTTLDDSVKEHGYVANQIKGNHECSKMVANVLPADTPGPEDVVNSSKFNVFRTWSCCI